MKSLIAFNCLASCYAVWIKHRQRCLVVTYLRQSLLFYYKLVPSLYYPVESFSISLLIFFPMCNEGFFVTISSLFKSHRVPHLHIYYTLSRLPLHSLALSSQAHSIFLVKPLQLQTFGFCKMQPTGYKPSPEKRWTVIDQLSQQDISHPFSPALYLCCYLLA